MTQSDPQKAYEEWLADPTPERMGAALHSLRPLLTSEIQRYPGPRSVLRGKAKELAAGAVRTYDPASGAKLTSWVTTSLQPLNRYGRSVAGSVHVPEVAVRQAAELETKRLELVDQLGDEPTSEQLADASGLSTRRVVQLRSMVRPVMTEGALDELSGSDLDDGPGAPGVERVGPNVGLRHAADAVYAELDGRDKQIFELKTGYAGSPRLDNRTVAKRLGVSPALISQRSLDIANRIKKVYGHGE